MPFDIHKLATDLFTGPIKPNYVSLQQHSYNKLPDRRMPATVQDLKYLDKGDCEFHHMHPKAIKWGYILYIICSDGRLKEIDNNADSSD